MSGKCRDGETFNIIASEFRLKAKIYDFDPMCEEDENMAEKIVDVEMVDYINGHIWYNRGYRSVNFELFFAETRDANR